MARAYILRILALEVFYIPVNGSVDNALKEQIEKYKANPNQYARLVLHNYLFVLHVYVM